MADGDSIEFAAKYGQWVAIKRMSITGDTKPEEVVFNLAAIRQSLDRKSFEFLGINVAILDAYATTVTGEGRKSISNLVQAIQAIASKEAKSAVDQAVNGKPELTEIANVYLLRKIAQNLKYDFDVNTDLLTKIYPNLKLPKPRGRKAKQ